MREEDVREAHFQDLLRTFRTVRSEKLLEILLAVELAVVFDEAAVHEIFRAVRAGEVIDAIAISNRRNEWASMQNTRDKTPRRRVVRYRILIPHA